MFDWLIDHIPLWAWAIPAGGVVFAVWWFAGFRAALYALGGVAIVMLTGGAYGRGRREGGADARAKQQKVNEKAVKQHEQIKNETGGMSDAELDAANDPWVRKRPGKR